MYDRIPRGLAHGSVFVSIGKFLLNSLNNRSSFSTTAGFFAVSLLTQIFLFQPVYSQVTAPIIKCADGDSLAWEIPLIDCGELLGFVIYRANEREGPYEILDTVFSPLAGGFDAPNPFGLPWFYFLSSLTDCDEEEDLLFSDTISNQPMPTIPILSLVVGDNGVRIEWTPSSEPHISQYVIYRNTAQGTIPIDTVSNVLEYLDTGARADERSEIYYVLAMDDCGTKSFFDQPHNTILLNYDIDACGQSVTINWNEYMNWPAGVSRYILWAEINGEFLPVDTIGGSVRTAVYDQLVKNEPICFYIAAENDGLGATSISNTICFDPEIVEPLREMGVFDICYEENSRTVDLKWYWNATAELEQFRIMVQGNGQNQFREVYRESITSELQEINEISLSIPAGTNPPLLLYIETTDLCGSLFESKELSILHLNGRNLDENTNLLTWNLSLPENATALQINLEKFLADGSRRTFDLTGQSGSEFQDRLQGGELNEGRICYVKTITGAVMLPNGQNQSFQCTSNEVCLSGEVRVYIPTAFRPEGVNSIFKPEFLFRDNIEDYRMLVYNRWGELIFESRNPDLGWNGQIEGLIPDPGPFLYTIEFNSQDGSRFRESGDFLLMR